MFTKEATDEIENDSCCEWQGKGATPKGPIMAAASVKLCEIFLDFQWKIRLDISCESSA